MLYFSNEKFEWQDTRKINEWSTERGSERADRDQMFASEIGLWCQQLKINNWLALWCYASTVTKWFKDAPRDNVDQMRYAEGIAKRFDEVKDIRLMPGLDTDKTIVMELRWHQAVVMLTRYAELKGLKKAETVEEIKTIPVEKPVVVVVEKEPVKEKPVDKPVETVEKPVVSRSIIGSIAAVIGLIADKLPVAPAIKGIIKVVSWAISSIFK
jgi:hypothetical protein